MPKRGQGMPKQAEVWAARELLQLVSCSPAQLLAGSPTLVLAAALSGYTDTVRALHSCWCRPHRDSVDVDDLLRRCHASERPGQRCSGRGCPPRAHGDCAGAGAGLMGPGLIHQVDLTLHSQC